MSASGFKMNNPNDYIWSREKFQVFFVCKGSSASFWTSKLPLLSLFSLPSFFFFFFQSAIHFVPGKLLFSSSRIKTLGIEFLFLPKCEINATVDCLLVYFASVLPGTEWAEICCGDFSEWRGILPLGDIMSRLWFLDWQPYNWKFSH